MANLAATTGARIAAPLNASSNTTQSLIDAVILNTSALTTATDASTLNTQELAATTTQKTGTATTSGLLQSLMPSGGALGDLAAGGGGLLDMLSPVASLIESLLGGSTPPAPLMPYVMPPSLSVQESSTGQPVTWGSTGRPTAQQPNTANITINAMDARSMLDRSDDIASAVQNAMQNMHGINDTISAL